MIDEKPSPMLHRPLHPALFSKVLTVMEYRRFPFARAVGAVRLIAIITAVTALNNSFFIVSLHFFLADSSALISLFPLRCGGE
jgi:hypothetical protein